MEEKVENPGYHLNHSLAAGGDLKCLTKIVFTTTCQTMTNFYRLKGETTMLWTIFVILLILWLLGLVSGYTIGGFIHILLVIAIVVVLIRIIQGRSPL